MRNDHEVTLNIIADLVRTGWAKAYRAWDPSLDNAEDYLASVDSNLPASEVHDTMGIAEDDYGDDPKCVQSFDCGQILETPVPRCGTVGSPRCKIGGEGVQCLCQMAREGWDRVHEYIPGFEQVSLYRDIGGYTGAYWAQNQALAEKLGWVKPVFLRLIGHVEWGEGLRVYVEAKDSSHKDRKWVLITKERYQAVFGRLGAHLFQLTLGIEGMPKSTKSNAQISLGI